MASRTPQTHKILIVATEAFPYVSVGGAGSVVGHLSKALVKMGHEVSVFIPKFGFIDEAKYQMKTVYEGLHVPTDDDSVPELVCNVKGFKDCSGVNFYFLENREYYEKRANVYGYNDDATRFVLLSRGALEFVRTEIIKPDIIHCNDWHTGALPNYIKTIYKNDPLLNKISTIFTIHNLAYQGTFDHRHVSELDYDDGKSPVASMFSNRINTQNFMRRGILFADALNAVSRTYAKEILTPEFGQGLDKLLLELQGKLFGIINGIDYDEFNPATDNLIDKNYDIDSPSLRLENKKALQKQFDLPVSEDTLLIGFVGRLDYMKGVDLLIKVLSNLLREYDIQFAQVGGGDWSIVEMLHTLKKDFPSKVGVHPYPNFTLPRMIFAGSDCIAYPSRFEPCGIVQIEAMRYGSIPIVRNVGGLADTVEDFDSTKGTGNGFMFNEFNEFSLYGQFVRAFEVFKNKSLWNKIQKNAMKSDYSWEYSAKEYVKLYERAISFKFKKHMKERSIDELLG